MYNFCYFEDHDLKDWALVHAAVWHEIGHQEAARMHDITVPTLTNLVDAQPRVTHADPAIQAQIDALPFVIDALATNIDINAYSAGNAHPGPPMHLEAYNTLGDHIAYRFDTGTGCLRGCEGYPALLADTAWVGAMVMPLLSHWEAIAFRANRLWNWHLSQSWAEGCKQPVSLHLCTEFTDID